LAFFDDRTLDFFAAFLVFLPAGFFAVLFADFVAFFSGAFFFTDLFAVFFGVGFAFAGAVFSRAGLAGAFRMFGPGGISGIGMAAASLASGM
jgi:hypothetical protein